MFCRKTDAHNLKDSTMYAVDDAPYEDFCLSKGITVYFLDEKSWKKNLLPEKVSEYRYKHHFKHSIYII